MDQHALLGCIRSGRFSAPQVISVTNWSTWCPQHSYREVGILLLYLAVGVSVFSGFAYTAEYEEVGLHLLPHAASSLKTHHWQKSQAPAGGQDEDKRKPTTTNVHRVALLLVFKQRSAAVCLSRTWAWTPSRPAGGGGR